MPTPPALRQVLRWFMIHLLSAWIGATLPHHPPGSDCNAEAKNNDELKNRDLIRETRIHHSQEQDHIENTFRQTVYSTRAD